MKVLAFVASSSKQSINRVLASYAAQLIEDAAVEMLDINDYEMPLFSVDREKELGRPEQAQAFYDKIGAADAVIVSYAEHNGSYTAAWKNLFDWTSRISQQVFQDKPVLYLATSIGPGGAGSVLAAAVNSAHFFAADVKASLSVPSWNDNFDTGTGQLTHADIQGKLEQAVQLLRDSIGDSAARQGVA